MTTRPETASVAMTRIRMLQSLVLMVLAVIPWPEDCEKLRGMLDSARSPELNRAEREGRAAGYYEGLIRGNDLSDTPSGEPSLRLINKPSGWARFREPGVVHFLEGDFLQFELRPMVRRTLFGQPFLTNAFGMHDDPVTIAKPMGTIRIAVLGSSMDMGWGVRYQDTYINQLEEWLKAHADRKGFSPAHRFEVLNFAVAAYSPMQRLETLRRKVLAFHPDLVIYSATTLDTRLMEIHLCEMLRKNVDLKYDFLRDLTAVAAVSNDDLRVDSEGEIINKRGLKSKLRPWYWGLYDTTLGAIAAECRTAGLPLVMVIIPRVGKADVPSKRAEPIARLKAIAAHHGLTIFDLSDTFDEFDPAMLEIAASDDHPNATGHRRLFLALARAIVRDDELYHLLFTADQVRRNPKNDSKPSRIGARPDRPWPCSRLPTASATESDNIIVRDQYN